MPYYAAISTDIKKSSTLWNNLPQWMFQAVMRTNNITEFVFHQMTSNKISKKIILPNSPEGDAYTMYFKADDQKELKDFVLKMAHVLQMSYKKARDNGPLAASNEDIDVDLKSQFKNKDKIQEMKVKINMPIAKFYRQVFVRVGVAFSDEPPVPYEYRIHDYDVNSYNEEILKSYRRGVIDDSERAEANAEKYDMAISVTQKGEKVYNIDTTEKNSSYKVENVELSDLILSPEVWKKKSLKSEAVAGFMIFIHFHFSIDNTKNPHLFKAMQDEFNEIHMETLQYYRNKLKGHLVKIKRSADAMIYLPPGNKVSCVWNDSLCLCSRLPKGSSIGICFTHKAPKDQWKATLQRTQPVGVDVIPYKYDFFGKCVNLSARMCHHSWSYNRGGLFKTLENNQACRVAMCCADNTEADGWSGWKNKDEKAVPGTPNSFYTPFDIEDIPKSALNAGGSERLRVISAHVTFGTVIHVGDKVEYDDNLTKNGKIEGTVVKLYPLKALIKLKDGKEVRKMLAKITKKKVDKIEPITNSLPKKPINGGFKAFRF